MIRSILRATCVATALLILAAPAVAQGFDLSKGGDNQIQVYADSGIEWHSEALRVIARGNAKAIRGTMTVTADTLTAHYRKGANGDEIWRLDAEGNVTLASPNETATGTKASYDLDKAIFVLRGQPARMATPTEKYSATESIEYWETQRMAVLRGKAVAVQADKKLEADVLTAHFHDKGAASARPGQRQAPVKPAVKSAGPAAAGGGGGSLELQRADAYGNVALTTASEVITGDRGDYNVESGIATVSGSVRITREGNQLNGGYANVNLHTGVSKLFGAAPGGGEGQRVQGVFHPDKKDAESRRAVFKGNTPVKPQDGGEGGGQPPAGEKR
jgi:lipopolysaccharide export system protein LptA